MGGLIQQNVGSHQNGVGEKTNSIRALAFGLLLELCHAAGLAEAGEAGEEPHEFRVLGDMALDEHGGLRGVDARGDELRIGHERALVQHGGIGLHREGMQIDDRVVALVGVLHGRPVLHRTEQVADVE